MSFNADLIACAAMVEQGDPERFAAAMASPLSARRVLFPLYAFNVEVSRAPWVTQEPMIAEMRLQWWRDALEEIKTGASVRRHEVVTPLSEILDPTGAQLLDKLVAARRWDIYKEAFEDTAHFDQYLDETSSGLMWVAARALSRLSSTTNGVSATDPHPAAETTVRSLGMAVGLARFLQAVPALESQGRIPLVDGRAEAIAGLAKDAMESLPSRRQIRHSLGSGARPAVVEAFLARPVLKQVAREPRRVADGTLAVNPLARSLLLWAWSL